jgi:hypothetical protein
MRKNCHSGRAQDRGRDPESRKVAENQNHSGTRLASRSAGLGRDDELRDSLKGPGFDCTPQGCEVRAWPHTCTTEFLCQTV